MTKEYLKMADVFYLPVESKVVDICAVGKVYDFESLEEYAAHAINSHDELVAEVERLRKFKGVATSAMKSTRAVLITALADYPEGGVERDVLQLRIEAISMLID